ncbi:DNA cytosine methyltransferase [Nocardioides pantholopis]|uniref:DNA cytosine methyltransferase n=1 Tax=Nocardioides pantholopis TaxID=2483798 RepID=UPI0013E36355|nr:DNA cytosine methyltransferase [Nocardioides pantholopis]
MRRRRLLDWFCCQGGASEGFRRAGWDVYGLDAFVEHTQARYPFPSCKADALAAFAALLAGDRLPFTHPRTGQVEWLGLDDFDAHAGSPPCQHASAGTRAMRAQGRSKHPALIEPTRAAFRAFGTPYVIENVKGAALLDPVLLCWSMFHEAGTVANEDGVPLRMERHRLFESNVPLSAPRSCSHPRDVQVAGSYGAAQRTIEGAKQRRGGYVPSKATQQRLLGIDWMTERAMHQAIPPAYTEHLGRQLMGALA